MPRLMIAEAKGYRLACEGRHELVKVYECVVKYGDKSIGDLWIVEGEQRRFMTMVRADAYWLFELLTNTRVPEVP